MKNLFLLFVFLPIFTFAQGYGIITLIKGPVQAKSADGKLRELKKGDKVFESETIITTDKSIARIVMMDTNIIDVYRSSKLLIKEYIYNPKEDNKNVKLEVTEGRIKSTVKQKYDNDKNKFNVKTPVIVAGVRGTIFTTEHESKSGESRVITHEGNVMVGKLDANDHVKEFFSVKANQTIQLDKQTAKPEVKEVLKPEVDRQRDSDKKDGFTAIEKEIDKNKKEDTKNKSDDDKSDASKKKSDEQVKNNDNRGGDKKDNDKKSDDSKKEDKAPKLEDKAPPKSDENRPAQGTGGGNDVRPPKSDTLPTVKQPNEDKRPTFVDRPADSNNEDARKQIEEEIKRKRKSIKEQYREEMNKKNPVKLPPTNGTGAGTTPEVQN